MKKILVLSLLLLSCLPMDLYAADLLGAFNIDEEELKGSVIGLGVYYKTEPYIGLNEDLLVVPIIVGRYKKFYADGTAFGYILNDNKEWEVSVIGQPRFMGYDSGDSGVFTGMEDREQSFDAGARLSWNHEHFVLDITGLTDIANNHQGQEVSAILSREFLEGGFTPRVGVRWWSDDLVDYYFGVLGSEATFVRPSYQGDSTVNFIAGVTVGIPLWENWFATLDFEYENYGSEVKDSPLVDAKEALTYVGGIVYRF